MHKVIMEQFKRNNLKDFYYVVANGDTIIFTEPLTRIHFDPQNPLIQEALSGKSFVYGPNKSYDTEKKVMKKLVVSVKVPSVKNLNVSDGGYASLVKDNLDIIAHPKYDVLSEEQNLEFFAKKDEMILPLVNDIKNLKENETKFVNVRLDKKMYYYNVKQVPLTNWFLVLVQPNSSMTKLIVNIGFELSTIGVIITLLLIVFSFYIANFLTRPIVKISNGLKNISDGD